MWMFVCVQHAYLLCRGDAPRACVWWLVARHDIMWKDRDYVQLNCMTQNYNRWVPKQGSVQCCYITLHPQGATMAHGIHTSRKLVPNCKRKVAEASPTNPAYIHRLLHAIQDLTQRFLTKGLKVRQSDLAYTAPFPRLIQMYPACTTIA